MPYHPKSIAILILTVLLFSYIIADCFFRNSAFDDSNKFTISLQNKIGSSFTDALFIIFCDILTPIVMAALLIMYYILAPGKIKTLSFIIYFLFTIYFTSLLKMFYHDPRPYWEEPEVKAKECYTEYGNPSGHSLSAILLFGMIWYRYLRHFVQKNKIVCCLKYHKVQEDKNMKNILIANRVEMGSNFFQSELTENQENVKENAKPSIAQHIEFFICSFILLLITFLILFGRIYLGMHSYNEVLLGAFYGFYFLILYVFYIEILIMKVLEKIIKENNEAIEKGKLLNWVYLAYILAIYAVLIVIAIITYEICLKNIHIPEYYYNNINRYCADRSLNKKFFYKCFLDCGIVAGPTGILIGLLLTRGKYETLARVYKKTVIPINTNENAGIKLSTFVLKTVGRIAIVFLVCGLPAGLLNISSISNTYGNFFVNNHLALLIGTLFLIRIVPFIFLKTKLERTDDLLCYRENKMVIIDEEEGDKLGIKINNY